MGIINAFKRLKNKFITPKESYDPASYLNWLKSKGIKLGAGCVVYNPSTLSIDVSVPHLLEIGNNVFMHNGLTIMCHDYASYVFLTQYNDYIPAHEAVKIGNNVWFGMNCTVLRGVTIGDNCIIGAGSTVAKSIPPNSVAVGSPAKVVCTLDEYYNKRLEQYEHESIDFALALWDRHGDINVEDFYDQYPVFVDKTNYKEYPFDYSRQFKPEQFEQWLQHHKAKYQGFEAFKKKVNAIREGRSNA